MDDLPGVLRGRQQADRSLLGPCVSSALTFHTKSRAIERLNSRWQTSVAPSQTRRLPHSTKALRVHDKRICDSIPIFHVSRDIVWVRLSPAPALRGSRSWP